MGAGRRKRSDTRSGEAGDKGAWTSMHNGLHLAVRTGGARLHTINRDSSAVAADPPILAGERLHLAEADPRTVHVREPTIARVAWRQQVRLSDWRRAGHRRV